MTSAPFPPRRYGPLRRYKLLLTVGFGALAVALATVMESTASVTELSIYQSTTPVFWVGVAVALVVALVVSVARTPTRWERGGGFLLAGSAVWAVVVLPLVRGYYFYGGGDALSHLGFARSFASGALRPVELLHPGVHFVSIAVASETGFSLPQSLMFTVFLFFLVFLIFVPLTVRRITGSDRSLAVGLFSALLLLPINHVATHVSAHPSSQAILFVPFVLFLVLLYLRQDRDAVARVSPLGVLLVLSSMGVVLFHPEEALNVLAVFGAVALLQFVYRRYDPEHPISEHHSMYFQAVFLGVLIAVWAPRSSRVQNRFGVLVETLTGGASTTATTVSSYSISLSSVGGSIEELFVKLFLPSLVFSIITGVLALGTVTGRFDDVLPERGSHVRYLVLAFAPILVATGVIYVGSFGDHYFRYIGFLMMLTTILGAVGLTGLLPSLSAHTDRAGVRTAAVALLLLLLLPIAVMSIHPSPWLYQTTPHVSEAQMEGYETSFEHRDPAVPYAGIRTGPRRYVDAVYGPYSETAGSFPGDLSSVPPAVLGTNLTSYYDEPRYVALTDRTVVRETELYRGFRYDREGFQSLETTPGISRIQANGEFQLYYVVDE